MEKLLTVEGCRECTGRALESLSARSVVQPVRWGVVLPFSNTEEKEGVHVLGHMPSYLPAAITGSPDAIEWCELALCYVRLPRSPRAAAAGRPPGHGP